MREGWVGLQANQAFAAPRGFAPAGFGQRKAAYSLSVDLTQDIGSRRWWRGLATLGGLTGALVFTAPGLDPLPVPRAAPLDRASAEEWQGAGVDSLGSRQQPALRMAADPRVQPIPAAPERARVDLFVTLGRDGVAPALVRIGASYADAGQAQALIRASAPGLRAGTGMAVRLGRRDESGRRPVESLNLRAALDLKLAVQRTGDRLSLTRLPVKVELRPIRIRGVAGNGLYWALRTAGLTPQATADYLKAVNGEMDVGEVAPGDLFDIVIASRRSADGEALPGPLLYAGLNRTDGSKLQLVRWTSGGKPIWVNAATIGRASQSIGGLQWPVAARITSGFGYRIHPILRFARLHRGIDFGAAWGTPIRAAADGQVTRAGWAGGYGRQVRLAHAGGLATSYSHMSSLSVEPGSFVRAGQLIGYVGSSGLSTGPHLHYEVYRGGTAVNPMTVRFASVQIADDSAVKAIRARLAELLKVGTKG